MSKIRIFFLFILFPINVFAQYIGGAPESRVYDFRVPLHAFDSNSINNFKNGYYRTIVYENWDYYEKDGVQRVIVTLHRCVGSPNVYLNSAGLCAIKPVCVEPQIFDSSIDACRDPDPPDPCEMLESACAGSQNFSVNFQLGGKKTGVSFVCMNPVVIGDDGSFPGCTRGCLGIVGGFTSAFQSDGGDWVTQGTAKFTGSTCDPSVINDLNSDSDPEYEPEDNPTLTEKPDETCPNGFKGTVNGVSVCLPPKASEGLLEKEEKDNGDGTKTEKQTKVKCENGVCEITTTTITKDTASNTVVSNSSATTTVEQGRFCAQNPTAAACKNESGEEGGGSFSGSCQAGFTCDGDAVMCAIAKEQHTRACQLFKEDTAEGQLYAAEKGKEGAQRGEGIDMGTIDLGGGSGSLIKTDSLIGEGSCVQDLQIQFMGEPVTIPLSSLCPYLAMLGNILVAVGMVMAIRIVGVR